MARIPFVALFGALVLAGDALSAATLAPGDVLFAPAIETPSDLPPIWSATFTTKYLNTVVKNGDADNPWGGLSFYYELHVAVGDTAEFARLSLPGFEGFQIEAGHVPGVATGPSRVWPSTISRDPNGGVIGVNFFPLPGLPDTGFVMEDIWSTRIVLHTKAHAFRISPAFALGDTTYNLRALTPIPEPSSIALATILAAAFAIFRCRRAI